MNRRTLLKYLLSTPLALTCDVDKLLWIPRQAVSIPSTEEMIFYGGGHGSSKTLLFQPAKAQIDFMNYTGKTVLYGGH